MNGEKWICHHYVGTTNGELIKKVKLHKEAFSKLIFADKKDKIYPIISKIDPKNNIVFFDDQYKVFNKIAFK